MTTQLDSSCDIIATLRQLGARAESIRWCEANGIETLEEAWARCDRGDWLLWLAAKARVARKTLVQIGRASCRERVSSPV